MSTQRQETEKVSLMKTLPNSVMIPMIPRKSNFQFSSEPPSTHVSYSSILVVRWYCIKLQLHRCESLCPQPQACEFWQKSLQLIQRLLKAKTREVKQKRLKHSTELKENSLHMRYFWNAQQQFFRQLLKLGSKGLGRAWRGLASVVGRWAAAEISIGSGSAPKLTRPYPWRPRHNSGGVI